MEPETPPFMEIPLKISILFFVTLPYLWSLMLILFTLKPSITLNFCDCSLETLN